MRLSFIYHENQNYAVTHYGIYIEFIHKINKYYTLIGNHGTLFRFLRTM